MCSNVSVAVPPSPGSFLAVSEPAPACSDGQPLSPLLLRQHSLSRGCLPKVRLLISFPGACSIVHAWGVGMRLKRVCLSERQELYMKKEHSKCMSLSFTKGSEGPPISFPRPSFNSVVLDAIDHYLVELQTMSPSTRNMTQTITDFRALQMRVQRIL